MCKASNEIGRNHVSEKFETGLGDLAFTVFLDIPQNLLKMALDDFLISADGDDSDPGQLPLLLEIQFGAGGVVPFHAVPDAVELPPLFLQGVREGKMDIQDETADNHLFGFVWNL